MDTTVVDSTENQRYELRQDGALASFTEYRLERNTMALVHTETEPDRGGQGLASAVIQHALDDARRRDLDVLPFCSVVRDYIDQHRDYVELVPESQREQFGL